MTTPQTIEQHAESILRAITPVLHPSGSAVLCIDRQAILTALTAYGVACAEAMREAAALEACTRDLEHPKGCWCSSCTLNDAEREIRALDANAVIKGMGHG